VVDPAKQIADISRWSHIARKEGLLSLESYIAAVKDPFAVKGLQLLVDGAEPERLREVLEVEITAVESNLKAAAKVWEAAGGYAPTIGILGAVMGLIHVMENLSDPSKLGSGIAVAFVATIYGVGAANLIFLPIAKKLLANIARVITLREMLVDGLVGIANGDNPRVLEGRLEGYFV
jgi:chemotaxis protein MotA